MSHYSWTKESRTLDKNLNGKKKKKKFYWERVIFEPSKAKKKKIIYMENDFGLISEIKNLTLLFNILSIGWDFFGFLELGVVLNLTLVFPLNDK